MSFLTRITCCEPTEMVMAQEKRGSTWLGIIAYRRTWICPPQRGIQRCPSSKIWLAAKWNVHSGEVWKSKQRATCPKLY